MVEEGQRRVCDERAFWYRGRGDFSSISVAASVGLLFDENFPAF